MIGRRGGAASPSRRRCARRPRRAAQRAEIADQIGEIVVAQTLGRIRRHQRGLLVDHFLQIRLAIPLDPLARVHDLDVNTSSAFLAPRMRWPSFVTTVTVSNAGATHSDGVRISRVSAACERGDADAGQVRAEPSAASGDAVTRRALLREEPFAVGDVADRPLRSARPNRCSSDTR